MLLPPPPHNEQLTVSVEEKIDLVTLGSSAGFAVRALSTDGKVVGSLANDDAGNERAVIWSGDGWQTKTDLGTLKSDNSGNSWVFALSADGEVAGGSAKDDAGNYDRAVLWSGDGWQTKTDLGTLKSDNSGSSEVFALSADGKVVGGWAKDDAGNYWRAVIWSGDGWQTKTDLGTLKSDNSGSSEVSALSADGSVAGGQADDDAGNGRAVLWKLRYSRNGTGVTAPELPAGGLHGTGVTAPVLPTIDPNTLVSVSRPVDVDNTRTVLQRLGSDTLAAADMQREVLRRVREHCGTQQQGELCYRIQGDVARLDDVRDTATTLTLGYGINNQLTAGASFSRSLNRTLGDTYRSGNRNNHAVGVFAEYRIPFDGGAWFVRPNAGWNSYRVHAVRPVLPNTEAGEGKHRMKAVSAGIEFGQQFRHGNGRELAWYAGMEYNRIKRNGYTETNANFPVTFGDLSYRDTALLLGTSAELPITTNLKAVIRADAAYSLDTERPQYKAYADYIGNFVYEGKVSRARGTLSAGLSYRFSPSVSAFVTPYVGKTIGGDTLSGASFGLRGVF